MLTPKHTIPEMVSNSNFTIFYSYLPTNPQEQYHIMFRTLTKYWQWQLFFLYFWRLPYLFSKISILKSTPPLKFEKKFDLELS